MRAGTTEVRADTLMALMAQPRGTWAASLARRPGTTATRARGQGHEIREIRPFAEGDDPRHLDAAATARTGTPHLRSFHEDRERTLVLIADFRRPMLWGTQSFRSVLGAEALALAGWQAAASGGSVGVAAITDEGVFSEHPTAGMRGMARVSGCLERAHSAALARHPGTDLVPALLRVARTVPRGAMVALASTLDRPGPGLDACLGAMVRRGPLRVILPADPFEDAPPRTPLPFVTEDGRQAQGVFAALPERRLALIAHLRGLGADVS